MCKKNQFKYASVKTKKHILNVPLFDFVYGSKRSSLLINVHATAFGPT